MRIESPFIPDHGCSQHHDRSNDSAQIAMPAPAREKKQVSDRASATPAAMSGKAFVLMANAGSQHVFFAAHTCRKARRMIPAATATVATSARQLQDRFGQNIPL